MIGNGEDHLDLAGFGVASTFLSVPAPGTTARSDPEAITPPAGRMPRSRRDWAAPSLRARPWRMPVSDRNQTVASLIVGGPIGGFSPRSSTQSRDPSGPKTIARP